METLINTLVRNKSQEHSLVQQRQGIAHSDKVAAFCSGKKSDLSFGDLAAFTPQFFEDLRTLGFSRLDNGGDALKYEIPKPFDAAMAGQLSESNVARVSWASHEAFSAKGVLLPGAIRLEYINARLHDGKYDLAKALAILRADPRIAFFGADERDRVRIPNDAPDNRIILPIPHYNLDSEHSAWINARFSPTAADAVKLQRKMESYKVQYPSTTVYRALFELDLLGLKKGGATKFKSW